MAVTADRRLPDRPAIELPIYADQNRHLLIWILIFGGLLLLVALSALTFHDPSFLLIAIGVVIGLVRTLWVYRGRFAIGSGWIATRSGLTKWSVVGLDNLASVVEQPLQGHFNLGDRLTARMVGGNRPVLVFRDKDGARAAIDPELLHGAPYDALVGQLRSDQRAIMEPQIAEFLLPT